MRGPVAECHPSPLLPSAIMADVRYTIHPPLDAERIMSAQLLDHAAALDGWDGRRVPVGCAVGCQPA